jgi:hypothetical protein
MVDAGPLVGTMIADEIVPQAGEKMDLGDVKL